MSAITLSNRKNLKFLLCNKPAIWTTFSKESVMGMLTKFHVHALYLQKHIIAYAKRIIAYKIAHLCAQLPILCTQMLVRKSGPKTLSVKEKSACTHGFWNRNYGMAWLYNCCQVFKLSSFQSWIKMYFQTV